MKFSIAAIVSFALTSVSASNSWAGSNLYFLQGLSDSQQNTYLNNLQSSGAKVVRLWVNAQSAGCQKGINVQKNIGQLETSIGNYDDTTLDALDAVLVKLQSRGMKALISPHDANMLGGSNGNDIYGQYWGSGDFYSSSQAITAYDNRLSHILNYKGKTSGQVWKNYKSAIMGFDIQNEPMAPKTSVCTNNDASNWMCGRAQHMRSVLGGQNPIKISTGGIGGDISHNCNFMQKAMACGQIDIVAVHAYKGLQSNNPKQWSNAIPGWLNSANGHLLIVEEWGTPSGSAQFSDFTAESNDIDAGGIPWIYWQVLPPKECSTIGSDTYGIFQGGGADISGAMQKAAQTTCKQDWTGVIY